MAEILKVQIEDENGNIHYPHTAADVVFMADGKSTEEIINTKVDKIPGKGLSENDYTAAEKKKLTGIAAGAEVNVQSDWAVTDAKSDAYIKNRPTTMKNPKMLHVLFNGRPWEVYDGDTDVEVDITPGNIGAALGSHNHSASAITQDASHRFATDTEKAIWNEIGSVKENLEKYASITVAGEILNLPGGGDIAVSGETLTIPLRI